MNEELPKLFADLDAVTRDIQTAFGRLSSEQVNWKPNPDTWSVAQCLQHLIVINTAYFPLLEAVARGEHRPSLWTRVPLLPRVFGRMVLKAVRPEGRHRFKTSPRFEPSASRIDEVVARFEAHQQDLVAHMRMTEHLDLRKVIITSPVASGVTYSLLDAYRIVVAHERRHLAQARRVREPH